MDNQDNQSSSDNSNKDNTQPSPFIPYITQQAILPGVIKQRHLVASPTQKGDMYYGLGDSFANLKIGTNGSLLQSNGTIPSWLTIGTTNQVLTVVGGVPTWATPTTYVSVVTPWTTFTPTFTGSTGTAGTFAQDGGNSRYTVIGNICYFYMKTRVTDKGSWTGDLRLAYPTTASSNQSGNNNQYAVFWTATTLNPFSANRGYAVHSTTTYMNFFTGVAGSIIGWASFAANDVFSGQGFFEV